MPYEEHVLLAQALAKGIPRGPQFGGIVAGPASIARSYADAPLAWALVTVHTTHLVPRLRLRAAFFQLQ